MSLTADEVALLHGHDPPQGKPDLSTLISLAGKMKAAQPSYQAQAQRWSSLPDHLKRTLTGVKNERGSFTVTERLAESVHLNQQGSETLLTHDHEGFTQLHETDDAIEKAVQCYVRAAGLFRFAQRFKNADGDDDVRVVDVLREGDEDATLVAAARAHVAVVYSNLSACYLRLRDFHAAAAAACDALDMDGANVKAAFRAAKACQGMDELERAVQYAEHGLAHAKPDTPQERALQSLARQLRRDRAKQRKQEQSMYGGMFDRAPASLYADKPPPLTAERRAILEQLARDTQRDTDEQSIQLMHEAAWHAKLDLSDPDVLHAMATFDPQAPPTPSPSPISKYRPYLVGVLAVLVFVIRMLLTSQS